MDKADVEEQKRQDHNQDVMATVKELLLAQTEHAEVKRVISVFEGVAAKTKENLHDLECELETLDDKESGLAKKITLLHQQLTKLEQESTARPDEDAEIPF